MAAEPVARDDQGAFRAGMQRAHASQVAAQKQALVEKIQARTVQDSLQKRANGVQAKNRRAGVPDARGRIRRVYRRRGCNPGRSRTQIMAGGPTGGRETSKTTFSTRSIRMFGAMSEDRLLISIVDSANSETFQEFLEEIRRDHPKFYMVLDNASCHKSKIDSGVRGICRRRHRPSSFSPRTRRSSTRLRPRGGISRDGWPAGISGLLTS